MCMLKAYRHADILPCTLLGFHSVSVQQAFLLAAILPADPTIQTLPKNMTLQGPTFAPSILQWHSCHGWIRSCS